MKLILLSNHLSIHTIKWARSLAQRGIEILIFSLSAGHEDDYEGLSGISIIKAGHTLETIQSEGFIRKIRYLYTIPKLKKAIKEFKPDIVHAHYATSYGLLGALSGFHPLIISVWGSDVFDFPSNRLTEKLLKFNLNRADRILSTSHVMAKETNKYVDREVTVTPFGINPEKFKPMKVESIFSEDTFTVGTIKSLEQKYGVDFLIRAFKLLKNEHPDMPLKLLIVGTGTQEEELKYLTDCLDLTEDTVFTGLISHDKVPEYLNMLHVYVAVSTLESESFGVAILEASSCEIPVVVSRVGGLPEVVEEGKTGLIVRRKSVNELFEALNVLVNDAKIRSDMGKAGRQRVLDNYQWTICVDKMIEVYDDVLK